MHHSDNEEFLGIDVGDKRVGIARGSTAAKIAEPLKTVHADIALSEIFDLIESNHIDGVVVGLPRNLKGDETTQTKKVKAWTNSAKAQINLPFYWQDEALTSVAAQQAASPAGVDAAAAAVFLQDFLDTPAEQRVRC